jgi:hypothetical protein
MPTLRSHTHLQATQTNAQTKACKRVCLPNRTRTVQIRNDRTLTERRAATNRVDGSAQNRAECASHMLATKLQHRSHHRAYGSRTRRFVP